MKEQEVEIAQLRRSIPNRDEQEQLVRNYQDLQQQLNSERQLSQSLRSQIIDPQVLTDKDQKIARLEAEKRDEIAKLTDTKDSEIAELRTEIDQLNADVTNKQKT